MNEHAPGSNGSSALLLDEEALVKDEVLYQIGLQLSRNQLGQLEVGVMIQDGFEYDEVAVIACLHGALEEYRAAKAVNAVAGAMGRSEDGD